MDANDNKSSQTACIDHPDYGGIVTFGGHRKQWIALMTMFGVAAAYTLVWGELSPSYSRSWNVLEAQRAYALREDSKGWRPWNLNPSRNTWLIGNCVPFAETCPEPFMTAALDDSGTMRDISIKVLIRLGDEHNAQLIERLRTGVRRGSLACRLASLSGLTDIQKVDTESLGSFLPVARQINGKKFHEFFSEVQIRYIRNTMALALSSIDPSPDFAPVLYRYLTETKVLRTSFGNKLAGESFAMSDQKQLYVSRLRKLLTDGDSNQSTHAARVLIAIERAAKPTVR
jgi:hypothetical protein